MKRVLGLLVAAVFAPMSGAVDLEAGKTKVSQVCAACHGANGVSVSPDFPNLAGQYEDYLFKALTHYANGKRKNPIMTMQVQSLKLSEKDMKDLAAYFSRQQALVVKH